MSLPRRGTEHGGVGERRVAPAHPTPVLDAESLELLGRLGNISAGGLMVVSAHGFGYGRLHGFRVELGPGDLIVVELGVELVWSKSIATGIASGFAIRRLESAARERLRAWIERQMHAFNAPAAAAALRFPVEA